MVRALAIIAILAFMAGCSTLTSSQTELIIQEVASDAGFIGYWMVPDARAYLNGVCALDYTDNATLTSQFVELVGAAWLKAEGVDELTTKLVTAKINRLVGALGVEDALASSQLPFATIKSAVRGVCEGVELAQSGLQ